MNDASAIALGVLSGGVQQGVLFSVLAVGLVLSFWVARFPDLTVEGAFVFGAAVSVVAVREGVSPWLALLLSSFAGGTAGLTTGLLAARLRVTPLLSGILTSTALYTVCLRLMGQGNLPLNSSPTSDVRTVYSGFLSSQYPTLSAFAALSLLLLALFASVIGLLRSEVGLLLRASGENPVAVSHQGRDPNVLMVATLVLANSLVGLGGGLIAQQYGYADVQMSSGILVTGLAMLYLGRTIAPEPRGRTAQRRVLLAAVVGAFVYSFLRGLAIQLGVRPSDLQLISALLVLLAVLRVTARSRARIDIQLRGL